jgi:hypothetical protein
MQKCPIENAGAMAMSCDIALTTALQRLSLGTSGQLAIGFCRIGAVGAQALGRALRKNKSLQKLCLGIPAKQQITNNE